MKAAAVEPMVSGASAQAVGNSHKLRSPCLNSSCVRQALCAFSQFRQNFAVAMGDSRVVADLLEDCMTAAPRQC